MRTAYQVAWIFLTIVFALGFTSIVSAFVFLASEGLKKGVSTIGQSLVRIPNILIPKGW